MSPLIATNQNGHAFHGLPSGKITYFDDALQLPIQDDAHSCDVFSVLESGDVFRC